MPIKVLIVDDSMLFREGLSRAMSSDPAIEVVGTAANAFEAEEKIKEICNSYDYTKAIEYLDKGYPSVAYCNLKSISGYAPAESKTNELLTKYPYLAFMDAKAGDEIILGKYEQDNHISNGRENITWIVLEKQENRVHSDYNKNSSCYKDRYFYLLLFCFFEKK